MFARTLGQDPKLLQVHLRATPSLHLKAWAVNVSGNALHALLINKGDEPVTVFLHLPATEGATVQRLLAPSPASRAGVTLDGQSSTPPAIGAVDRQPRRSTTAPTAMC